MKNMNDIYICRICGYNNFPGSFWTEDGIPEYVICPCCGSESGYEDLNIEAIKAMREKWLKKTENKFVDQLKNIEKKYK